MRMFEDPFKFIQTEIQTHNSRNFLTRLALKQTIVLAEHKLIKHFLDNCMQDFYNGLKDNYSELFGDSILFADANTAIKLREILLPLFHTNILQNYEDSLQGILKDWSTELDGKNEVNLYEEIKQLALTFNLEIFLGIHHKDDIELLREFSGYSREHWHGVIAIPMNIRIPFWGNSGYSTAVKAKQRLIEIIQSRYTAKCSEFMENLKAKKMADESVFDHLLLFSCALIPKAVGAILSVFFELGWYYKPFLNENGELEDDVLERILLEIARMYPPFIGGIRVASTETTVGGYHIPKGTGLHYSLLCGMRDPVKFPDPDTFNPDRWRDDATPKLTKADLLSFGSGPHDCVGRHYSWRCVMNIARFILKRFDLTATTEIPVGHFPAVKYLPCLRPATPTLFQLTHRSICSE